MSNFSSKDDLLASYYQELGQFVTHFALVETVLIHVLQFETKTPLDMSKVIFTGVRADQAKTLINRAREANKKGDDETLKRVFAHLTIIANVRNDLLHHGPFSLSVSENELMAFITNFRRVPAHKAYHYPVTTSELRQLSYDCETIYLALSRHVLDGWGASVPELDVYPKDRLEAPWQYKSQPRSRNRQRPRANRQDK